MGFSQRKDVIIDMNRPNKIIRYLRSGLRELYAIEVLEYENKNHLAGDSKSRSNTKQTLLLSLLDKLSEIGT